ncbi:hypothetical protein MVEN_01067300 [Mycena venus]|uniref:DUF6534 domain-containing protein n=1 Tax=Mycena venus TaxID=2733690 RepID=A0A8H7CZF1_9AGAR|nr:hypothetical protein MVEN_01067300 [Mycena venus]
MSATPLTLPMFIGMFLNWGLFGILLVQVYIYFSVFSKDRTWWKALVVLIVFLEVVETFSSTKDMIQIFGTGWGNMNTLDDVGWAWFSVPVMGAIIAFVCQSFYGWRIYIIGQSPFFFALVLLVSLVQLAAGIWTGATATWLATTSLADLLIVFGTMFYLRRSTDPEFTSKRTNSLISRLIMLTAETGVVCALCALVDLVLFAKLKGTNWHLSVCIELSKIYSNSILLIFNSRAHMGHGCNTDDYSVNLSNSTFRTGSFRTRVPTVASQIEIGVHVSNDHYRDSLGKKMDV